MTVQMSSRLTVLDYMILTGIPICNYQYKAINIYITITAEEVIQQKRENKGQIYLKNGRILCRRTIDRS